MTCFEKTNFAQYGDIPISGFHLTASNVIKTEHENKFLVDLKPVFCRDASSLDGKSSVLFSLPDNFSR